MKQGASMNCARVKILFYFFPLGGFLVSTGGRPGENMFLRFSVFEASLSSRGRSDSKESQSVSPWRNTRRKKVSQVKKARITHFSLAFCTFFTLSSAHGIDSQRFASTVSAKVTAQNGTNWAGATPLFCGRAAQKVFGVAPAHMLAEKRAARPRGQSCC